MIKEIEKLKEEVKEANGQSALALERSDENEEKVDKANKKLNEIEELLDKKVDTSHFDH